MIDVKAIETRYNGTLFRSRTEARWAVFFDALGVRWEYEHEGYQLRSGPYLPDFWLPEVGGGMFVEVKPERRPTAEENTKLFELVSATRRSALMAHGSPGAESMHFDGWELPGGGGTMVKWMRNPVFAEDDVTVISDGEPGDDWPYYFCACDVCGRIGVEYEAKSERVCNLQWEAGAYVIGPQSAKTCFRRNDRPNIAAAREASRVKRFW